MTFSTRAELVARRTYCRPRDDGSFETWSDVVNRVIGHQRWLWERQLGRTLNESQDDELKELHSLFQERKALPAGRTLWLGGTDLSKRREISQFNCSGLVASTVYDVVDAFWLLLNGSGVGFIPRPGSLNGFARPIAEVEVVRSRRSSKGGRASNRETFSDGTWTISLGDSGEAWAKAIGKLLAGKYPANKLVLDFSEIRPQGVRLSGYGWICAGDSVIAEELPKIVAIMNRRAGRLLSHIDIHDIMNHLGVIQTGRRGAEIGLYKWGDEGWAEWASMKKDFWTTGNSQRAQSNNSLLFYERPTRKDINSLLEMMVDNGGSEPGFFNAQAARQRAPYFETVNPCVEQLLANHGLCNLVENNIAAYRDHNSLHRAHFLLARANYRQTLVNLDDGILQRIWHENNEFLRLCGVSITGIVRRQDLLNPFDLKHLRQTAQHGAHSMADELGMPRAKNVTSIKPSGTVAKIMDTTEGIHRPNGRFIFNNITFSKDDPLLPMLQAAGYRVFDNPLQPDGTVVTFPVEWTDVNFGSVNGTPVNTESAFAQLERYRMLMNHYVDHNASCTVSYSPEEIPTIAAWLEAHWDEYVGVSFLPRTDPTKTAKDLGYPFLPQEVTTREAFEEYTKHLRPVDLTSSGGSDILVDVEECIGGVCPVR